LIRSLTGEGRRIADERKRHTGALAEERESIAELEDLRAKHGDFADPQPFREKFAAFTPVLKASEGRTKLDQEIRSEVRNVREAGILSTP
jgi:hypothetical protein